MHARGLLYHSGSLLTACSDVSWELSYWLRIVFKLLSGTAKVTSLAPQLTRWFLPSRAEKRDFGTRILEQDNVQNVKISCVIFTHPKPMPPNVEYCHHIYYHGSTRTCTAISWKSEITGFPCSRIMQLPLAQRITIKWATDHLCTRKDCNARADGACSYISCVEQMSYHSELLFWCHGGQRWNMLQEIIVREE